ncbi:MAG: hypothetical protein AB1782_11295 [Cyanobacteriota bacterium]
MNLNSINFAGTLKTSQKTIQTSDDNDRLLVFSLAAALGASSQKDFSEVSRKDGVRTLDGKLNEKQALEYLCTVADEVLIKDESMPKLGDKINVVITGDSLKVECKDKFTWEVEKNNTNGIFKIDKYMGDLSFILNKLGNLF